jgi:predicted ATPase
LDSQPTLRATLYEPARQEAARHWLKAGQHALRRSANTEAIAHLTNGIGALTGLSESIQHAWSELKLQLALGPTLSATHGWSSPEAERAYRRAEQLAQGLGADRERFDAVWGLWMINNTGNAPDVALGITSELFQIADQLDDATLRMEAHHASWASANTQGELAATIEHVRQGLAIYDPNKHGAQAFSYGGHDTAVCGKAIGGRTLWALGYPDQAICSTDAAITLAEALGHAPSLAHALLFASFCRQSAVMRLQFSTSANVSSPSKRTQAGALSRARRGHSRMGARTTGQLQSGLAELKRNLKPTIPTGENRLLPTPEQR